MAQAAPSPEERDRFWIEFSNSMTHGVGVLLGILFLVLLLIPAVRAGNVLGVVAYAIYGGCFIFLFLASTVYHAIPQPKLPKVKDVLRVFDHVAIYLFIAGSFTPPVLLLLQGTPRVLMLVLIWAFAVGGTIFKAVTHGRYDRFQKASVLLYVGMGWLGIFLVHPLVTLRPWPLVALILLGGILYTVGTFFYRNKTWKLHHVIWHLFVLAAATAHFLGYYFFL